MTGPSRRPEHTPPTAAPHRPATAPPGGPRPPAPAAPSHTPSHPHLPRQSHVHVPDLSHYAPKARDLCALGKRYGGWRKDSPEAVICEEAYGH